jgi:hypothetical protein
MIAPSERRKVVLGEKAERKRRDDWRISGCITGRLNYLEFKAEELLIKPGSETVLSKFRILMSEKRTELYSQLRAHTNASRPRVQSSKASAAIYLHAYFKDNYMELPIGDSFALMIYICR